MTQQLHSIAEIKDMLADRAEELAHFLAPPAQGAFTDKGKYFTLNPFRADTRVGSFYVQIAGDRAGTWYDFAMREGGDMLDLICKVHCVDLPAALKEARGFLGLTTVSPADVARRKDMAKERAARHRERQAKERQRREHMARTAHAIWLSGQAQLRGTPVDLYLRDRRGIELDALGRNPGSLRYVPKCRYAYTNPETGEFIDCELPAMVALVCNRAGDVVACHRHYLGLNPHDGRWDKAPLPMPKKALGSFGGAWIDIWKGQGPRGGKPMGLRQAPEGTRVYLTEGVEDALSAAILLPHSRVIAGISLSNLGAVDLPACVGEVVIVADQDENDAAREQLDRAIAQHGAAGRSVRLWQNGHGGKDLNDALRALREQEGAA